MTFRWNVLLISHVKIVSCAEPKLWRNTMLSLQDSVFFEISIKSLLKSWSSSCEYPAKPALMFTFFTRPPDLSPPPSKETLCSITCPRAVKSCSEVSCFLPVREKWLLMELSGWLMVVHQACFMRMQVAAALSSPPVFILLLVPGCP